MKNLICKTALLLMLLPAITSLQAEEQSPHAFVSKVTQDALNQLREKREAVKSDPSVLNKIIMDYVLPHMDFIAMSKLVLKENWKAASAEQRNLFTEEFKNLLVRTYTKSLREYSSEKIEFLPYEPGKNPNKVAVVQSQIKRSAGADIPINYRLRYKPDDGWKVFDITIEGVSLIKNYQGSFAREISQNGIDKLIESLQEKNQMQQQSAAE